jgi:hypothetical protein
MKTVLLCCVLLLSACESDSEKLSRQMTASEAKLLQKLDDLQNQVLDLHAKIDNIPECGR